MATTLMAILEQLPASEPQLVHLCHAKKRNASTSGTTQNLVCSSGITRGSMGPTQRRLVTSRNPTPLPKLYKPADLLHSPLPTKAKTTGPTYMYSLLHALLPLAWLCGRGCDCHSPSQKAEKPTYWGPSDSERRGGKVPATEKEEEREVGNRVDRSNPQPLNKTRGVNLVTRSMDPKHSHWRRRMWGWWPSRWIQTKITKSTPSRKSKLSPYVSGFKLKN